MSRFVKNSSDHVAVRLEQSLEDQVEPIKEFIMDGYDSLSAKVNIVNSKTNPEIFRDQFSENLSAFEFLQKSKDYIQLVLPVMGGDFNFSNIPIVEQILEGTAGTFVEITHEDLVKLTGKTTVNKDPVDASVSKQKRIYLVRYDDKVRRGEKEILKKNLTKFPFSNTPSLDDMVFGPAQEYVDDNINKWIERSLKVSTKEISQKYGK